MVEKKKEKEYQEAGQEIYDKLHLATFPVAIKYYKDKNEIPRNVTRPYIMGKKMSICQTFAMAREPSIKPYRKRKGIY